MPYCACRPLILLVCLGLVVTAAFAQEATDDGAGDGAVATFEDESGAVALDRDRFVRFLIDTRGLDALLNLMQLELAKEQARRAEIEVTPADVEAEFQRTLDEAFAGVEDLEEYERDDLLEQLLARQQLSRAEFDLIIETNAYLKAIAGPTVRGVLTDEMLRDAFSARYGEQAKVRVIGQQAIGDFGRIRQRLDAGESFEALARELNVEPDLRANGGELPPFTRRSNYPEAFKAATFALEPGGVSEIVQAGDLYYLIQLEEFVEPTVVTFEDVRDALADTLVREQVERSLPQLRRRLATALASESLVIDDPELAEQLQARLAALQPQPTTPEALRDQLKKQPTTTRPAGEGE